MTKTLIDLDDVALGLAQQALGTATKRDTVNSALLEVAALAARRRDLVWLCAEDHADLLEPATMSKLWLR